MTPKTKTAMKRTFSWGLAFSVPLAVLLYFQVSYGRIQRAPEYGEVAPFFFTTADSTSLSNHDLRQHVNLLLLLPSPLPDLSPAETGLLEGLTGWAKEYLQAGSQAPGSYQLFFVSGKQPSPALPADWRHLPATAPEDMAAFLPAGFSPLAQASLVLVDENTRIRGVFQLTPNSLADLKSTWAKLTFNHYLDDYLSKRTFFGPRRSA